MKQNVSSMCYCLDSEIRFYFREKKMNFLLVLIWGTWTSFVIWMGCRVELESLYVTGIEIQESMVTARIIDRFVIVTSLNTT